MADRTPTITVLAGTNGAGKSSIIGQFIRQHGGTYYNPDEFARDLRARDSTLGPQDANSLAWKLGVQGLEAAITTRTDYVFETTLGGNTIPALLGNAARQGIHVTVWYVGLDSVEEHIRRVILRVQHGGHDIPEDKIRERFVSSIENLVALLPDLHELKVFDNSLRVNLAAGKPPQPRELLHIKKGRVVKTAELHTIPEWAKPLIMAVLRK